MATLTLSQVKTYAQNAGFSGASLATIVAIAEAESGFNPKAVNANDPNGGSFGILQINGVHKQPTSVTFDPQASFDYAYQLSQGGTNFSAWSTFTSGAYKATQAWQNLTSGSGVTITSGGGAGAGGGTVTEGFNPLAPFTGITDFLNAIGGAVSWIGNPTRVFKMLVGIGLIFVSILLLVATHSEQLTKVASKLGVAA